VIRQGDALNAEDIFQAVQGADVVLSAVAGFSTLLAMNQNIISQVQQAGVKRLYLTGGAGALNIHADKLLYQTDGFPQMFIKITTEVHMVSLEALRATDLDWTYVCPGRMVTGGKTGQVQFAVDYVIPNTAATTSYADVADAILQNLTNQDFYKHKMAVVGPSQ
jgi:hypothetical protein